MQVWIISFVVLFVLYECWDWLSQLNLPLPVFVVGGLFLAIASNYDKRGLFPWWPAEGNPTGAIADEKPASTTHSTPTNPAPTAMTPDSASPIAPLTPPIQRSPRLPFEE
jgi:hypothetical protein